MLIREPQQLIDALQHGVCLRHDGFTHRSEDHPPPVALDERHAEGFLELLQLRGERWLADEAGVGGATEVTVLREGHQVFEVAQVHGRQRPLSEQTEIDENDIRNTPSAQVPFELLHSARTKSRPQSLLTPNASLPIIPDGPFPFPSTSFTPSTL